MYRETCKKSTLPGWRRALHTAGLAGPPGGKGHGCFGHTEVARGMGAEPIWGSVTRGGRGGKQEPHRTGFMGHGEEPGFYPTCDEASPGGVESHLSQLRWGGRAVQEQSGGDTSYDTPPGVNVWVSRRLH